MFSNKIKEKFRVIVCSPWTIFFNFYYLPFRQAIKLPIRFFVIPTFSSLKGKVIIDSESISSGMIRFGRDVAPIYNPNTFIWRNFGRVVFKGNAYLGHHFFLSCGCNSTISFGNKCGFGSGCRIISEKKISFGNQIRCSWDCTFIDTDYHPVIDLLSKKKLKQELGITLGDGVWVGHNSLISKGSKVASDCIISSGSVIKGVFKKSNCIIGGNLAQVIDENYCRDDRFIE